MSGHADGVIGRLDGLVDGIRRRDPAAFRQVYDLIADDLGGLAYRMLNDRHAAEDAVQQAFLELTESADRIRGGGRALRAWLFSAVRFTCLDQLRVRKRRPEEPVARIPERGTGTDRDTFEPGLAEALSRLSERHRTVLHLKHVADLSGDEIARVMGINRAAVYAIVTRATGRLRRELESVRAAEQRRSA